MSSIVAGTAVGAGVCLLASPYLARLSLGARDDELRRWWAGRPAGRRELALAAGLGVVLGGLAGAATGWTAVLPALVWLALLCVPLVMIDLDVSRLPNRLVFTADLGAIALLALAAAVRHDWHPALRAAEGALAVFAVLFGIAFVAGPKGFGYGDVKLGGLLGGYLGWFGWFYVYYGIFAGFLLGALLGIALIAARRAGMKSALPFGPSMIVGALVVLAFDLVPSVT